MKSTQGIRDVYRARAKCRMAQPYDYEGITVPVMAYELLEILDDADRCAELEKAADKAAAKLQVLRDAIKEHFTVTSRDQVLRKHGAFVRCKMANEWLADLSSLAEALEQSP